MNFNNFNYLARKAYKSIPFISPALQRDFKGNNLPETDGWVLDRRYVVLFGLSLGSCTYIPTLAKLVFPYIVSSNSSVTFTAVASFATPATILIGILALGVLGLKLDAYLTDRAKEEAAINQFMHNEKPGRNVFEMLTNNSELIKLLLKNKDVDLSKQNSEGQTLITQYRKIWDYDLNVVSLLWDHSSDAGKVNFLISSIKDNKNFYYDKIFNFLVDEDKVSPEVFANLECLLTIMPYGWSKNEVNIFSSVWDRSSDAGKIKALNSFLKSSHDLNSNKIILEHLINNQKISVEVFSSIENKYSAFNSPVWSDYEVKIFSYLWNYSSDAEKFNALSSLLESPRHVNSNKRILEFLIDNKKNFPAFIVNLENILPAFNSSGWSDCEVKIFSWIWDHSSDKDKVTTFSNFMKKFQSHDKIFTEEEQYKLQNFVGLQKWSERHLEWLKILGHLGFNIDAKGKDSKSVKEHMLDDIFRFTHGYKIQQVETIISLINFLQSIEKHPTEFSIMEKIPTQLLEWLQENLEECFPKEKIDKNLLNFFVTSRYFLMQMSDEDNVEISRLIWDKANDLDKKAVFKNSILKFKNSKLAIALMEDKKVSAGMFTEKEQYSILYDNLIHYRNDLPVSECFKLLVEIDFNIDARGYVGEKIKDILLEKSECTFWSTPKRKAYFKEALDEVDDALKKQVIKLGITLKSGQNDQGSNLFMIPGDIFNNIVKAMADTL